MENATLSGTIPFEIDVPYKLFETGEQGTKPLIIYLHGFRQNITGFHSLMQPLMELQAYHLFVQGPYPVYERSGNKKVEEWGRAWYLYDGEQEQFIQSLEHSSSFLEDVIKRLPQSIKYNRLALLGYSMGGYLAGYFALSRKQYINDLVVIGSRIKTEVFEDKEETFDQLNVLALHGRKDASVQSEPQGQSCRQLAGWGADVTFKELDEGHRLTPPYLEETKNWLINYGYT